MQSMIKPTKIYVCGKMTGLPDNNYPESHRVSKELQGAGYEVVNPAELQPIGSLIGADKRK